MIDTRAVGAYISQLRRDADLTQAEMANKLNVTHQAVSKWENGLALPDVQTLLDLANLFGVSIEQILGGGARITAGQSEIGHSRTSDLSQRAVSEGQTQDRSSAEPSLSGADDPGDRDELRERQAVAGDMCAVQGTSASATHRAEHTDTEAVRGVGAELDLDLLTDLAPFMSREAIDRIFEMACVGEVDPDCLVDLAPFVSRDKLEKAVDLISEGKLSIDHLEDLAPFLGRDALRKLLLKIEDGSLDRQALVSLAPFLGPDLVEAFVFGKVRKG